MVSTAGLGRQAASRRLPRRAAGRRLFILHLGLVGIISGSR